jgi:hypothetical protein
VRQFQGEDGGLAGRDATEETDALVFGATIGKLTPESSQSLLLTLKFKLPVHFDIEFPSSFVL